MERLLEVGDLHVAFPSKREAVHTVDGVSFQIFRGETFGLVGKSGCGKSQTLRSILGLLKQPGRITGDAVRYKEADIAKVSQQELQKIRGKEISMVFQEPMAALNPVLHIRSQMYGAFEGEKLSRKEKYRRAIELLKLVGIPSPEIRLDGHPHQLSGSMCQHAMITIALGARPKLLLANELTTALDVAIQGRVIKLLNRLKQGLGMSVILVTHDLGIVARICDQVAVVYAGQIAEMIDTVTLFNRLRHSYTYDLMGSLPNEETADTILRAIEGSPPNLAHLPEGCPLSPRCRYTYDLCRRKRPVLTRVGPDHLACYHRLGVTASFQGLIGVSDGAGQKEDTPHG